MDNFLIGLAGFALTVGVVLMCGVLKKEDKENYTSLPETKTTTPMPEVKPPKRSHHKKVDPVSGGKRGNGFSPQSWVVKKEHTEQKKA